MLEIKNYDGGRISTVWLAPQKRDVGCKFPLLLTEGEGKNRPSGGRGGVLGVGRQERGAVRLQEGEGVEGRPQVGGVQAAAQRGGRHTRCAQLHKGLT